MVQSKALDLLFHTALLVLDSGFTGDYGKPTVNRRPIRRSSPVLGCESGKKKPGSTTSTQKTIPDQPPHPLLEFSCVQAFVS